MLRMLNPSQWSERTMIALVMQHLDNSITTYTKRDQLGIRRMVSKQGHGEPNPTWIPVGNEVTRRIAEKIDGVAGGTWGELFNIPLTAHFLGGAAIGDSPEHGVIDPYQRVYGYPTMSVVDGASRLGQPRRQPVAEHHRAGRAGGVAVAEQGPGRICGRRRARPTSGSHRSRPSIPSFRPTHPRRCAGYRSSRASRSARRVRARSQGVLNVRFGTAPDPQREVGSCEPRTTRNYRG